MPITINTKRTVAPTVNRAPLNTSAPPAGAFGEFTANAQTRAAQELGKSLEQGAEIMLYMEEQDNLNAAMEMELEFSSFIKETMYGDGTIDNPGYMSTQGYNAIGSQLDTNVAIEQFAASKVEGASNARIAKLFGDASVSRIDAASNQINYHAIGQRSEAIRNTNIAYRQEDISRMEENTFTQDGDLNLEAFNKAMVTSEIILRSMGEDAGESIFVTENNVKEGSSEVATRFAMAIARSGFDEDRQESIELAKEFVRNNSVNFTPAGRAEIEDNLNSMSNSELARESAERTLAEKKTKTLQGENYVRILRMQINNEDEYEIAEAIKNWDLTGAQVISLNNGGGSGDESFMNELRLEIIQLESGDPNGELDDIKARARASSMTNLEILSVYINADAKLEEDNPNINTAVYKRYDDFLKDEFVVSGYGNGMADDYTLYHKVALEFGERVSSIEGGVNDAEVKTIYEDLKLTYGKFDRNLLTDELLPFGWPSTFDRNFDEDLRMGPMNQALNISNLAIIEEYPDETNNARLIALEKWSVIRSKVKQAP